VHCCKNLPIKQGCELQYLWMRVLSWLLSAFRSFQAHCQAVQPQILHQRDTVRPSSLTLYNNETDLLKACSKMPSSTPLQWDCPCIPTVTVMRVPCNDDREAEAFCLKLPKLCVLSKFVIERNTLVLLTKLPLFHRPADHAACTRLFINLLQCFLYELTEKSIMFGTILQCRRLMDVQAMVALAFYFQAHRLG